MMFNPLEYSATLAWHTQVFLKQEQCPQPSPMNGVHFFLDNKANFFSGRQLPFLRTRKVQPQFRWPDSIKMNLLLKAEEPSFLMARIPCMSKMFWKEREGRHIAPKYIAILTSRKSTLSPRLFSVSSLKAIELLLSKIPSLLGLHNLHLQEGIGRQLWE